MSNTKNTGGPAFPTAMEEHKDGVLHFDMPGMTLRDYFAAKAMQALIHASFQAPNSNAVGKAMDMTPTAAYEFADAMLKAREQ